MHFDMPKSVLAVAGSCTISPPAVYDKYASVIITTFMPCSFTTSPVITVSFTFVDNGACSCFNQDNSVASVMLSILAFGADLGSHHSRQSVCNFMLYQNPV